MTVDLDRLKQAFDAGVEAALPGVNFQALYTCTVVAQNSDGTLELMPKSGSLPANGYKHIPIRYGVPGVKITVQAGAQVLLGWENGDPSVPYAALWVTGAAGDLQDLTIDAAGNITIGQGATLAAARATDPVSVATSMASWISAVTSAWGSNSGIPVTIPPPTDFGQIQSGSGTVKIKS